MITVINELEPQANLVDFQNHLYDLQMGLTSYVKLISHFGEDIGAILQKSADDFGAFVFIFTTLLNEAIEIENYHGSKMPFFKEEDIGREIIKDPQKTKSYVEAVVNACRLSLGEGEPQDEGMMKALEEAGIEDPVFDTPLPDSTFDVDGLYYFFCIKMQMDSFEFYHSTIKKLGKLTELTSKKRR